MLLHPVAARALEGLRMRPVRACAPAGLTCTRTVLFDADGTLLDSLPPHIDFLRTLNDELGTGLELPQRGDVDACRRIAAAPMANFFREAGFPDSAIEHLVANYESRFARECPVFPFPGVEQLIGQLTDEGVACAIVSSNTAVNVQYGLGPALCARLQLIMGIDNGPADKANAISAALSQMGADPASTAYVGDTRKDAMKAAEAGVRFVGVSYGFEPLETLEPCGGGDAAVVVGSVGELESVLLGMCR